MVEVEATRNQVVDKTEVKTNVVGRGGLPLQVGVVALGDILETVTSGGVESLCAGRLSVSSKV